LQSLCELIEVVKGSEVALLPFEYLQVVARIAEVLVELGEEQHV